MVAHTVEKVGHADVTVYIDAQPQGSFTLSPFVGNDAVDAAVTLADIHPAPDFDTRALATEIEKGMFLPRMFSIAQR